MAINKKLIRFKRKSVFEEKLANNEILETSIVFIEDTKEIWTHGCFYGNVGSLDEMVLVTYDELKSLRDDSQLVPGRQYRITDYVTTTSQENTQSAGHQFDIIVTADDEKTLNEAARACLHEGDTYFSEAGAKLEAWQIWYCLDNDNERFAWADVPMIIYDSSNCIIKSELIDGNAFKNPFSFSGYMWDDPVNGEDYVNKIYGDDLVYEWDFEEEPNGGQSLVIYKSDPGIYVDEGVDYNDKFYYRGVIEVDGEEYDCWQKCEFAYDYEIKNDSKDSGRAAFALTERIVEGDVIIHVSGSSGKGVIYRMIDEWNNDCPYDFKNIQFKRGVYDNGLGIGQNEGDGDYTVYCYTFSWEDDEQVIMDASIVGNNGYLLNDEGQINGVYNNVIKPYINYTGENENPRITQQFLNNIVFLSTYAYEGNCFYGCFNNSFGDACYNNSFGDACYNNSFGDLCFDNFFRHSCAYNTFGNNCYYNSFGSGCTYNTFGNNFDNNSFGVDCNHNNFGNNCYSNIIGDHCWYNSLSNYCTGNHLLNDCSNNSFGNNCQMNWLGNYCWGNSFGNSCHDNCFREGDSNNRALLNHCDNNHFDDGCSYNTIWNDYAINNGVKMSDDLNLQNITITRGVSGTSASRRAYISVTKLHADHEIKVAKNSAGEIKVYCEADLIA